MLHEVNPTFTHFFTGKGEGAAPALLLHPRENFMFHVAPSGVACIEGMTSHQLSPIFHIMTPPACGYAASYCWSGGTSPSRGGGRYRNRSNERTKREKQRLGRRASRALTHSLTHSRFLSLRPTIISKSPASSASSGQRSLREQRAEFSSCLSRIL